MYRQDFLASHKWKCISEQLIVDYLAELQYVSLAQSSRDLNHTGIQWNKCAREFTRLVSVGDTFLDLMS